MGSVSPVGKLRNKITIQTTDLTADTHGGFTKANNTYVTAFANIKPKPAKQYLMKQQVKRLQTHKILNLLLDIEIILRLQYDFIWNKNF